MDLQAQGVISSLQSLVMNNRKLLSIVVPTKDRYKYLKYLIELIASFNSDEVELVIQDNSEDNKEILDFLKERDYNFVTKKLLYENYSYDDAINNGIAKIVNTDVFTYKK